MKPIRIAGTNAGLSVIESEFAMGDLLKYEVSDASSNKRALQALRIAARDGNYSNLPREVSLMVALSPDAQRTPEVLTFLSAASRCPIIDLTSADWRSERDVLSAVIQFAEERAKSSLEIGGSGSLVIMQDCHVKYAPLPHYHHLVYVSKFVIVADNDWALAFPHVETPGFSRLLIGDVMYVRSCCSESDRQLDKTTIVRSYYLKPSVWYMMAGNSDNIVPLPEDMMHADLRADLATLRAGLRRRIGCDERKAEQLAASLWGLACLTYGDGLYPVDHRYYADIWKVYRRRNYNGDGRLPRVVRGVDRSHGIDAQVPADVLMQVGTYDSTPWRHVWSASAERLAELFQLNVVPAEYKRAVLAAVYNDILIRRISAGSKHI